MEPVIASIRRASPGPRSSRVRGRPGLGARILAINLLSVLLVGASFLYLDSYRNQLIGRRLTEAATQADLAAAALRNAPGERRDEVALALARAGDSRLRIYAADGSRLVDSWRLAPANFSIRAAPEPGLAKRLAARLDDVVDSILFAQPFPRYEEPARDRASAWPEVLGTLAGAEVRPQLRLAADRTAVVTVARPLTRGRALLITVNARDLRRDVRAERLRLATAVLVALLVTALLSAFLARTIVTPIRRLSIAAHRVRLGRQRDVVVPRMTERADEIGVLARAVGDMATGLRDRADAIEAFAADVSHELKNPLASLSSAVQSLERVEDAALRRQLIGIVGDDARRMDRLVTDIADASRLDATLARSRFEPVDLTDVLNGAIDDLRGVAAERGVRLAFARQRSGTAVVAGLDTQLRRAFDNVVGNAVSFAPPGTLVEVRLHCSDVWAEVDVEDEGPGVRPDARDAIFRRFHSERPDDHRGGRHSGLGLAIARAVVDGHGGTIAVAERADGGTGARFHLRLPLRDPSD